MPDHVGFKRKDQVYSPKTNRKRLDTYGIMQDESAVPAVARPLEADSLRFAGYDDDEKIEDYSVFKAKKYVEALDEKIERSERNIGSVNFSLLMIFCVLQMMHAIIFSIIGLGNVILLTSVKASSKPDANLDNDGQVYCLIVIYVMSFLQAVVIGIYLYLNRKNWKTRVVKTFQGIEKSFMITAGIYLSLLIVEMAFSFVYIQGLHGKI